MQISVISDYVMFATIACFTKNHIFFVKLFFVLYLSLICCKVENGDMVLRKLIFMENILKEYFELTYLLLTQILQTIASIIAIMEIITVINILLWYRSTHYYLLEYI